MKKHSKSKSALAGFTTLVTAMNLIGIAPAFANTYGSNPAASEPALTLAGSTTSYGATTTYLHDPSTQTSLTTAAKIALLQKKVKYVFVLYQENRAFDHYFGTYPGANGLLATYPGANANDPYSQPGTAFSSYSSVIRNVDGTYGTISPWLLPRTIVNQAGTTVSLFPESIYSVDHSHRGYLNDYHADAATQSTTKNDGYPLDQEALHYGTDASGTTATIYNSSGVAPTSTPTLQTKQKGEIVMAHVDCDTIPFLWQYADRFTLFDNFHQTATGPSTPNAIAMLAGQVGDTQWVLHPNEADPTGLSLPVLADTVPFPGSTGDTWSGKPPFGFDDGSYNSATNTYSPNATTQVPLTFASLPLSFMGSQIATITRADQHAATDLLDVKQDIQTIALKNPNVSWGWYQQGFGPEPIDGTSIYNDGTHFAVAPEHASLVTHHVGPQYFGYLGDNATVNQTQTGTTTPNQPGNLHGLQQFYTDVTNNALPAKGGVFYVRGGYYNDDGLTPADPNTAVQHYFSGNDDHGSYSDSQISEALVADSVNAIVNSPYWPESAIIITYDESDGFFDHMPENFRTYGPDGHPETGGPRIPTIVISPFAAVHTVSHVYSEHSAVIKFINEVFGLQALSSLPNEAAAETQGAGLCPSQPAFCAPGSTPQTKLGPADTAAMGDLLEAFDNDRLLGNLPTLLGSYAQIGTGIQAANTVTASLPHYQGQGCMNPALNVTPTDYTKGYGVGTESDPPPLDFNPRPTVSTGSPYYNTSGNTAVYPATGAATGTGGPWAN
jgi:phospholipase C